MAVDALSRRYEDGGSATIASVVPDYQDVTSSYKADWNTKELLEQLVVDPLGKHGYTLANGLIRYQGRLVIGGDD